VAHFSNFSMADIKIDSAAGEARDAWLSTPVS